MWVVDIGEGKYQYVERYDHILSGEKRTVSTTLKSKSPQAWKKAEKILKKKAEDKNKTVSVGKIKFGDAFEKFNSFYIKTVKESTAVRHTSNANIVKKYIKDNYLLSKINTKYIENMLHEIHHTENYSKSTTKQIKSLLSMFFKWCKKQEYIENNPVLDVEIRYKKQKPVAITDMYLTKQELKQLIDYTRTLDERRADVIEMLAYTGMRYGELINLTEDDYFGSEINIIDAKTPTGVRTVPITDNVKEILNRNIAFNKVSGIKSDYIFVSRFGNRMDNPNFNRQLREASEKLGIKKHVTAHIFRHTYITILAELGVDLKSTMYLVGHAKPEVTLSIYTHVSNRMAKTAVNKMNDFKLE